MTTPRVLCSPTLGLMIAQEAHWTVVLNRNQNLPGGLMLVPRTGGLLTNPLPSPARRG